MIATGTIDAIDLLNAGWRVRHCPASNMIEWLAPSGETFAGDSLDDPPDEAVALAIERGDIAL